MAWVLQILDNPVTDLLHETRYTTNVDNLWGFTFHRQKEVLEHLFDFIDWNLGSEGDDLLALVLLFRTCALEAL